MEFDLSERFRGFKMLKHRKVEILSYTVLVISKHHVRMVVPWVLRNFPWPFADPLQKIKVAEGSSPI